MRFMTKLAAPLVALGLSIAPASAETFFAETFQDQIRGNFGNIPFEFVPVDQVRPVGGFSEFFNDPVTDTSGLIVFRQRPGESLSVGKRNFCLSGCAQFTLINSFQITSDPAPLFLQAGQDYRLSIRLRLINGLSPVQPAATVSLLTQQGGALRGGRAFGLFNDGSFETYALDLDGDQLISAPATFTIGFTSSAFGSSGIFIDELRLETVNGAAPVPVPASAILLVTGIGGLALSRHKKRRLE